MNEQYAMPAMPRHPDHVVEKTLAPDAGPAVPGDVRSGILKGIYRFRASSLSNAKARAQLLGSGAILPEVIKAQEILEQKYGVGADVWSVTSYSELYRDGHACERWNLLHPGEPERVPYLTACLKDAPGVFIAASDYIKALPDSIDKWLPRPLTTLGTDGFGRSESRASLREFFEVDYRYVILATLAALARDGRIEMSVVQQAIKVHNINPGKPNPATS
jgi:pyruvate dehydrogenase E1 component